MEKLLKILVCLFSFGSMIISESSLCQTKETSFSSKIGEKYDPVLEDLKLEANQQAEIEVSRLSKENPTAIEIIVDSSGSMGQEFGVTQTKMYHLKTLLYKILRELWKTDIKVGLRLFGHQTRDSCEASELMLNFRPFQVSDIFSILKKVGPVGMTPMHESLMAAIRDLKKIEGKKEILLFTDGHDTCGGDPCKTAKAIEASPETGIRLHTISLGMDENAKEFQKVHCDSKFSKNVSTPGELEDHFSDLQSKIFEGNNLFVDTPQPDTLVHIYKKENGKDIFFSSFTAKWGTKIPPGSYSVVVQSNPKYKFPDVNIVKGRKYHLKVEGTGFVHVNFNKGELLVEVLNRDLKVIQKFPTDRGAQVKKGFYYIEVNGGPFYKKRFPAELIMPGSKIKHEIKNVSILNFKSKYTQGFYIYKNGKNLVGQHVTNQPFAIQHGNYNFYLSEKCAIENFSISESKKYQDLDCSMHNKKAK